MTQRLDEIAERCRCPSYEDWRAQEAREERRLRPYGLAFANHVAALRLKETNDGRE